MLKNKRLNFWIQFLLILLIFIITFIVNFAMLNINTAPPGADYGNYLTQVNILNGNDLRGWGLRHQPVFFVLLDVFLRAFDEFTALKVAAAFVFSIIIVPFFLLAKKLSGNFLAAAISTGLFGFFISYTEMIAWGGNPNFLAFSFLLIALYFIIDLMKEPSKKNVLFSGLFLSLVVGTHILVAIFAFASLALFFILHSVFTGSRKVGIKTNIKNLIYILLTASIFSLPYVSFYLNFFRISSSELVGFRLLDIQISGFSPYYLWVTISLFFTFGAIGIVGLFGLSKYIKENKANALLICSLFVTPLLLFLTTAQPIRWIYFMPIPFLLCFNIFLRKLFTDVKNPRRTTIVLFTALFLVTIILQTTYFAGNHFENASVFYQFIREDEIKALNWIKEVTLPSDIIATSGHVNDVGGGGNSYAWWVEGYSNRTCMFTGNLEYFSYQYERDEVRKTNRIFRGIYSVEYGNLKVIEGAPGGTVNPEIATRIKDDYENLFVINDYQNFLYFSSVENNETLSVIPFFAESIKNKTITAFQDDNLANITTSYELPNFEVTRNVIVEENKSSVDVFYRILPVNSTLRMFRMNLWSLFDASLENSNVTENNDVVLLKQFSNENVTTTISVMETNGKLADMSIIFADLSKSKPVVNYAFEPKQKDLYVHIRVSIDSSVIPENNDEDNILYDSYTLIKDLKINYLMVNKFRDEYRRFLYDTEHFTIEFENYAIAIFKVDY
jgi:hypothetical protein